MGNIPQIIHHIRTQGPLFSLHPPSFASGRFALCLLIHFIQTEKTKALLPVLSRDIKSYWWASLSSPGAKLPSNTRRTASSTVHRLDALALPFFPMTFSYFNFIWYQEKKYLNTALMEACTYTGLEKKILLSSGII